MTRAARTLVMGILNVTPDSFSDGGRWPSTDQAVAHALALVAQGADLIDVGGESTRPGADRVSVDTELDRVLGVVRALVARGVRVSVDTMRAEVAGQALRAGASWINDVSGGLADPAMLDTVAALGGGYIAMHWRGHSDAMYDNATYRDVVGEVCAELAARRDAALAAGIEPGRLVLDPGIGFAKSAEHNWELLRHLDAVASLGQPVLLGVSRKRFLAQLADDLPESPPEDRDIATAVLTVYAAQQRLWAVRTHEVRGQRDAIAVVERMHR